MPNIQLKNVSVTFTKNTGRRMRAVDNVSLDIDDGEFIAIVGPSGCGKSTLLNAVSDLVEYDGEILVDGRSPSDNRRQFGYMFQEGSLLPWRTARKNAQIGLEIRGRSDEGAARRVEDLMERVGLGGFSDAYPSQLSGGMKKRLSLVQTLAYDPPLLLMDEPFGALDFQTRMQVEHDFLQIVENSGKTVLFVTHDIDEAIELADRVLVMTGRPGAIKRDHRVPLDRPRALVEHRGRPEFVRLRESIWEDLKHDFGG